MGLVGASDFARVEVENHRGVGCAFLLQCEMDAEAVMLFGLEDSYVEDRILEVWVLGRARNWSGGGVDLWHTDGTVEVVWLEGMGFEEDRLVG